METEKLVIKAKKGDKEALLQLVLAKQTEYYRLAYVYTQNREDALDAMENMIVILYENVHRLKNNQAFYGWSNTMDNRRTGLLGTVDEKIEKGSDGTITRTRTLHFKGTGKKLVLDIQRMSYRTDCHETIDIPVN